MPCKLLINDKEIRNEKIDSLISKFELEVIEVLLNYLVVKKKDWLLR